MTRRKNNWPAALALFLEEKQEQPFDWKTNNCGFFACDWLAVLMQVDPAEKYRARIDSALSAARVLEEAGGIEAIASAAAEREGWPSVAPTYAMRGDIVLGLGKDGPALGVCLGEKSAFAGRDGILLQPTLSTSKAWRIG